MALRQIVLEGDGVLSKKCRPVEEINSHIIEILDDMEETMKNAGGLGLAAPQVGVLRSIVCIDFEGKIYELINPKITEESGEQHEVEACLSVPGYAGVVKRPAKVKLEALDRFGNKVSYEGEGLLARAFCHETDHLKGILYIDKAEKVYTDEELKELEESKKEAAEKENPKKEALGNKKPSKKHMKPSPKKKGKK